jgi:glycosyltransferase involved in cell wall biosynthesis
VILVDGNSTDNTVAVVEELRPRLSQPVRIIYQTGRGKGNALKAGFAACTGDIIVMLDADGSTDPRELPFFVASLLRGNDFAKGSRCILGGGSHDFSLLRRLGNYGLLKVVNLLFRTRFSDLCYGYNAFWRYCLDYMAIDSDGFEIETLIHLRIHKAGLRIVEVPSLEYRRIHGKSNLNVYHDGLRVLKTILAERFAHNPSLPRVPRLTPPFTIVEQRVGTEEAPV